ncbi:unnamed protein product [Toxocara canis]|uniref:PK_Tyr_Ser-Thr domain-containing protein n=1 Tax=Toxocara canis TaxID=6265 RepID=A0A183VAZ2_TOXCA|nr:unnamed protein product [Toxocara canis]
MQGMRYFVDDKICPLFKYYTVQMLCWGLRDVPPTSLDADGWRKFNEVLEYEEAVEAKMKDEFEAVLEERQRNKTKTQNIDLSKHLNPSNDEAKDGVARADEIENIGDID